MPSTSAKWTMFRNGRSACTPAAIPGRGTALMHCLYDQPGLAAIASCRPACNTHASCPSQVLLLVLKHGKYTNLLTDLLGCMPAPKSCRDTVAWQHSLLAAAHLPWDPTPCRCAATQRAPVISQNQADYRQFSVVWCPSLQYARDGAVPVLRQRRSPPRKLPSGPFHPGSFAAARPSSKRIASSASEGRASARAGRSPPPPRPGPHQPHHLKLHTALKVSLCTLPPRRTPFTKLSSCQGGSSAWPACTPRWKRALQPMRTRCTPPPATTLTQRRWQLPSKRS